MFREFSVVKPKITLEPPGPPWSSMRFEQLSVYRLFGTQMDHWESNFLGQSLYGGAAIVGNHKVYTGNGRTVVRVDRNQAWRRLESRQSSTLVRDGAILARGGMG